jgi:arylsulfatase A-like enzyme
MKQIKLLLFLFFSLQIFAQESPWKIYWDEHLTEGKKNYLTATIKDTNTAKQPNIIIILADDLGQTDISLYGSKYIETPNIDAIGKNGITFTEGYISSPVCSPSRAGILTGRYQQRFGHELQMCERYVKNKLQYWGFGLKKNMRPLTPVLNKDVPTDEDRMRQGLPPSEITLAEILQKNFYHTAIIGKWHLGAMDFAKPCNRGFEYQYGFSEAYTLYADPKDKNIVNYKIPHQFMDAHQWKTAKGRTGNCAITKNCCTRVEETGYLTDKLTDEAIKYMSTQDSTHPFFIYLTYNAPHVPLQATTYYYNQFAHIEDPIKRTYLAMIKNLDDQIGRLTKYLDSTGLSENTIVFFLSDNGGAYYNGTTDNKPYRGGKLTNFEGGLKVPFMMQWKGKIESGIVSNPVISLDIFSTVCKAANIYLPTDRVYDGIDLMHYTTKITERSLYWRSAENSAIRSNNWKLIINDFDKTKLLYDLTESIDESNNVYTQYPKIATELENKLKTWNNQMGNPLWPRTVNYLYKDKLGIYYFAF